jgi:hypothetical protein
MDMLYLSCWSQRSEVADRIASKAVVSDFLEMNKSDLQTYSITTLSSRNYCNEFKQSAYYHQIEELGFIEDIGKHLKLSAKSHANPNQRTIGIVGRNTYGNVQNFKTILSRNSK